MKKVFIVFMAMTAILLTACGSVDPDFKATFDDYEACVDEYYDVVMKVKEAGSIGEADRIIKQYNTDEKMKHIEELGKKIQEYSNTNLTSAERKYAKEVMERILPKLQEVLEIAKKLV